MSRLLPRQPESGRNPLEYLREREPIRPEYRDRDARIQVMDEQGLDKVWLFPTLGMIYEELLKHDPEGVGIMFTRLQPLARRGLGLRLRGPDLRGAVHLARRPRLRGRGARVGAVDSAPRTVCMRPAAPTDDLRTAHAGRSRTSTRSGPASNEAGITVVVHAGDSGYSLNGYAKDGFSAEFSGRRPPEHRHDGDRARDLRLPRVADLRPALRPLPEPAGRVGRERRRVPRPTCSGSSSRSTGRSRASSRRTRSRRSGATSGSTRSGRTTSTRSSTSWAPTAWSSAPTGRTSRACPNPLDYAMEIKELDAESQRLIMHDNAEDAEPAPAGLTRAEPFEHPAHRGRSPVRRRSATSGESRIADAPAAMRLDRRVAVDETLRVT